MFTKISAMLDDVANSLEERGFTKEAFEIDVVANTLEKEAFLLFGKKEWPPEQELIDQGFKVRPGQPLIQYNVRNPEEIAIGVNNLEKTVKIRPSNNTIAFEFNRIGTREDMGKLSKVFKDIIRYIPSKEHKYSSHFENNTPGLPHVELTVKSPKDFATIWHSVITGMEKIGLDPNLILWVGAEVKYEDIPIEGIRQDKIAYFVFNSRG